MAFPTPDFNVIRDGILRDIKNQHQLQNNVTVDISSDTDYYIRANATGSAVEGLYQHQQWIIRQLFPDSADNDYLEHHANQRNLYLKAATAATGTITFSGTAGSPVPIGTEVKTAGSVAYITTAADVIGAGGTVTITAQAEATGSAGNQAAGTALTLTAAPTGVLSSAVIGTMTGGTDTETYLSLLSRLLFFLRNPPCGGAAHDYYTWAMNVPGVTAAYVYPNRRGLGTTDVVVMTAGGIAAPSLVAAVQAYIDGPTIRPTQADFLALAPTAVPVNIAGTLVLAPGYILATVAAAINSALAAYFNSLKPGDTAYLHRIRGIITDTPGVVDFVLTSPTANVAAIVDATHSQLATLGTTAWS